jgi:hypothetical protein
MTDQNRLIVIESLGYQSEFVAANIEHSVDPPLITFPDRNAICVRVSLSDILQASPSGHFCDSIPAIQCRSHLRPMLPSGLQSLLPADDMQSPVIAPGCAMLTSPVRIFAKCEDIVKPICSLATLRNALRLCL